MEYPLTWIVTPPPSNVFQDYTSRRPLKHTHTHTHVNITRIQHEIHIAQKIQHKVGVLSAGLEALRTTKIVETSSLSRYMYMVGYIVKIHTTQLYNTPIQHENQDIKR